jgi:hypothetical protein
MAAWFDIASWSDIQKLEDVAGLRSSVTKVEELVHHEECKGQR